MSSQPIPPNRFPGHIYSILRSFLTLARNLNLSRTTKELNITRQSVRRHIDQLEEQVGARLFKMEDNEYCLTPAGKRWMSETANLLEQMDTLFGSSTTLVNGLPLVNIQVSEDHRFYAQQHPAVDVWANSTPPLIKKGLEVWVLSQGALDHHTMEVIRPYLLVYRQLKEEWICTEVGDRSSYATWLGSTWAKSAIGQTYEDDPIKSQADAFMVRAHRKVSQVGAPLYYHISTKFPRREFGELVPVNYQKLVLPCRFPNGSPAVVTLVARTDKISIEGLSSSDIAVTPQEDLMEFDI